MKNVFGLLVFFAVMYLWTFFNLTKVQEENKELKSKIEHLTKLNERKQLGN